MSKIDLSSIDEVHMTDSLLSQWLEIFRRTTGKFPDAIIVTLDQAKKFFLNANEIMTDYKGVPLEIQKNADERATVIKTINAVMTGMHNTASRDVSEVYRLLEGMKAKMSDNKGEQS